jgi:hypothetical protein
MARPKLYPVAVVVFVNAEGADAHDAANVAEIGLAALLAEHSTDNRIAIRTRAGDRTIQLGEVAELGHAQSGGGLRITASAKAFPA